MSPRVRDAIGRFSCCVFFCVWLAVSARAGAETRAPAPAPQTATAADDRWQDIADIIFRHIEDPGMRFAGAITQDQQGFIWLATQGGLVRWDGYHSKTYHADPQDPDALPDNYVTAVHTDPRGRLWVGTSVGGLALYDPQHDRFLVTGAGKGGLDDPTVATIAADGSLGLWVGTGKGLDHLDLATNAIRAQPLDAGDVGSVKSVLEDPDGGLWVGTEKGLLYRARQTSRFLPVVLEVRGGAPASVCALMRDSAGNLWIGTRPYGAFVLQKGMAHPRAVRETDADSRLGSESILSIVEPRPGEIWLGSSGRGIVSVDVASWKTQRLRHHADESSTLRDDDVHSMYRDRSGLVWVSSTLAFSMTDPRITGVSTLFGTPAGDRPLTAVEVPFLLAMPDGRVWLSVGDEGGIDILDPRRGRVAELRGKPEQPERHLPPSRVLTMALAPNGSVYIGTRHGLYAVDATGRRVTRIEVPGRPVDAGVWTVNVVDHVLWLGGVDGLWAIDATHGGAFAVLRHFTREQFSDQRVVTLLPASGHTLWVGTSSGLSRLDTVSGQIDRIPTDATDPHSLSPGYAASLLIDRRGRLWVGSDGAGIQVLEGWAADGRPRFRRLGLRDGLPHMGIDKLLLDEHGSVWASTDGGLAEIDPETFAIRSLGAAQGVAILAYWADSGAVTADGDLLFGGQGGLTIVRPFETRHSAFRPPVVVTEASVGGVTVNASRLNAFDPVPRLDLPAGNPSLMVEFSALDFTMPENNQYSYRLQGFESAWNFTPSARRLAAYTNLPPGDYTLQLRGSDHESPASVTTLSIPVRVLPAWYQTLWFKLAAAALSALLVYVLVQRRTAILRRRQRRLEALIERRTADLKQRTEELERSTHELRASQRELERMAYLDPLTGLANRRLFSEELHRMNALAVRGTAAFTLLLVDLDRFKLVNDNLGHGAGDALLVEVALRLKAVLRESDRICRLGGDEFAILIPYAPEGVDWDETVCERVLRALREPFRYGNEVVCPAATIGAVRCPQDAIESEALYKCADSALYAAKNAGRDTWRWYSQLQSDATEAADSCI